MRSRVLLTVLFAGVIASKVTIEPVGLDPGDWLGVDGNWSTVRFLVGSPVQPINVLASTSLSEFWAVGPGGCPQHEVYCATGRGGIYTPRESRRWISIGIWQLGLSYLGYGGNGHYGLDSVGVWSPLTNVALNMPKVLMSAINTTDYYIGLFGLGINQGTFGKKTVPSPLTEAVQTYGWIPSYSYGYTAGASYRGAPVSLTLGGVDVSRFQPHQIEFVLSPDNLPRALVRGIQVVATGDNVTLPANWGSSTTSILSTWDDAFTALIDSTTPYLWLPEAICDRFSKAFNLTYNSTLELYTLSNDQYEAFSTLGSASSLAYNFTFSFTSIDNHDNFGRPLDVPGVVNLTVPIQAFVNLLQYPYKRAMAYGDPAIPYFAIKKSTNSSSMIIGRSFLQETYLLTKYDYGIFKLLQARYTSKRLPKLMPIRQPNGSPYPPPAGKSRSGGGFGTAQIAGIAVGAVAMSITCFLAGYCYLRRKHRRQRAEAVAKECKNQASPDSPDHDQSRVSQILSKVKRNRRQPSDGSQVKILDHPSEAPNSEIYELPVAMGPVELDAAEDDGSILEEAALGTHDAHMYTTSYELARMKMDRQLQGPAPEYSPPADGVYFPPEKKLSPEPTPAVIYPTPEGPTRIPCGNASLGHHNVNTLPSRTFPSPVSPHSDSGNTRDLPLPSPATVYTSPHNTIGSMGQDIPSSQQSPPSYGASGIARPSSAFSNGAQSQPNTIPSVPSRPLQRDPIDPTNIVCLGELPDSLQLLRQNLMASHAGGSDGQNNAAVAGRAQEQGPGTFYVAGEDSLPSTTQFPVLESRAAGHANDTSHRLTISTQGLQPTQQMPSPSPQTAVSEERVDGTRDLVHVPQVAANRYSWEPN